MILVVLHEQSPDLLLLEDAPEFVKGLAKGLHSHATLVLEVEVLEGLHDRAAFVLALLGFLADLLINDVLEILKTFGRDILLFSCYSPGDENKINEVVLLLTRERGVHIGIVLQKL